MTWFKVDDGFPEHPKLESLEHDPGRYMAAVTVWTIMGADCARRNTDGKVTRARLGKVLHCIGDMAMSGADALVEAGLWEALEGEYQFHDWADYQPTKADVEAMRRSKTERQRRWREPVDASTAASTRPSTAPPTNGSTRASHDASTDQPVDATVDAAVDASRDALPARGSRSRPVPIPDPPKAPRRAGGGPGCATESAESVTTVHLVAEAVKAGARERHLQPTPLVPPRDLEAAAERVDEAVLEGIAPDAATAATALVEAAFALGESPRQRPLRFALLEATIAQPNGKSAAQAQHVPPEDPWV